MNNSEKTGRGSLSYNDFKKSSKSPDYRGQCVIDGVEYLCSMWSKPSNRKDGKNWFSISLTEKPEPAIKTKQEKIDKALYKIEKMYS